MRGLQLFMVLALLTVAHAGKVTWDSDGKAHIEKSDTPREGCQSVSISDLGTDSNSTKC